jgi:hypothetical protein
MHAKHTLLIQVTCKYIVEGSVKTRNDRTREAFHVTFCKNPSPAKPFERKIMLLKHRTMMAIHVALDEVLVHTLYVH